MEKGVCPKCGSVNIKYNETVPDGEYIIYPAECDECNTEFDEVYRLEFIGFENISK